MSDLESDESKQLALMFKTIEDMVKHHGDLVIAVQKLADRFDAIEQRLAAIEKPQEGEV